MVYRSIGFAELGVCSVSWYGFLYPVLLRLQHMRSQGMLCLFKRFPFGISVVPWCQNALLIDLKMFQHLCRTKSVCALCWRTRQQFMTDST